MHMPVSSAFSPWCRSSHAASDATSVLSKLHLTITSGNQARLACRRLVHAAPRLSLQQQIAWCVEPAMQKPSQQPKQDAQPSSLLVGSLQEAEDGQLRRAGRGKHRQRKLACSACTKENRKGADMC
jgi:hypothetical protein